MRLHPSAFSLLLLGLSACSSRTDVGTGDISVVLTDSASDELVQFEVDVDSIVLTQASGTQISVMPRATRVDFADLTSVGELITATQLPAGGYVSMTMNLDFSNAAVALLGQTGPATVVDATGTPITGTFPVQVDFTTRSRPVVRNARHHLFQLDLDLEQAISVDVGGNEVRFAPVLSVSVDPANPRPVTTTAILTAVDTGTASFTVERRALDGNALATWTVRTANLSVFQIDGVVSLGSTGLAGLAAHVGERVFVQGTLDPSERVISGVAVETGAGVPGNGQDWVFGHVTGRDNGAGSDAALTVVGRSFDVGTATRRYNTVHTINVAHATTKVLRRGAGNLLDTDSIDVGQLVFAFGDLAGTTMDATAATGVVRLLPTRVFGIAAGAPAAGVLTLDVSRFDLRSESAFNWTVGGVSQADPNAFTVDVGTLDTASITAGSKVEVSAWINPVGIPGDENCTARSIVDHSEGARALFLQWGTPSATALSSLSATAITIALAGASIATVGDGFQPVAVTSSPAPKLEPLTTLGIYRIVLDGGIGVHFTFDSFQRALAQLQGSRTVFRIGALGTYDQATQTFSALTATVVLR